ncbi:MAG: phage portal protein [Gemmatimonadetes bacterium]|nr:phage portal protein [Gemmatimonadota bacterium]
MSAPTAHALLRGNGYAAIQRELNGQPYALHLCKPDRVRVERTDRGELVYRVRDDNGDEDTVPARDMFHLRGLGYDGIVGYSVLHLARQSLGLSSALETFGAGYFGNGTHPSGVLSTDQARARPGRAAAG